MKKIIRAKGDNDTEQILAKLCDNAFLKLWVYPNPYKSVGLELCDVLVVFENNVFIFSVKDIKFNKEKDIDTAWNRWKKKAIDESIKQIIGAEKWLTSSQDKLYLDPKCQNAIPINIPKENLKIHKIIVAHGASDACSEYFGALCGSLPIMYYDKKKKENEQIPFNIDEPFRINLDKNEIIHLFDSSTLDIILSELDTITDFTNYILAKEEAIRETEMITYCGEEDLLGLYLKNYDDKYRKHYIVENKEKGGIIFVVEGTWDILSSSESFKAKKNADKISYFWDKLLQKTSQNALDRILGGNADVFNGDSAVREMAKEPRFIRRHLSSQFLKSVENFPEQCDDLMRNVSGAYSNDTDIGYVFLQLKAKGLDISSDEFRKKRIKILEIACGTFKNKFPKIKKIIGIGVNAPKFYDEISEDLILLKCEKWSEEDRLYYEEINKEWNFWQTDDLKMNEFRIREYPKILQKNQKQNKQKVGRNDPCPCGSGKKYKKCCIDK